MQDIAVISDPAAAAITLDPVRARLLAALERPGSASSLAGQIGLPRQKVNYHLRTLEDYGLIELVAERKKGNVVERVLQATAASYVISPTALADVAPDPNRAPNQLSARWLLALGARLIRELGDLVAGADRAGKPLATYGIDADIRFATAADRAAFATELGHLVKTLVAKYHSESAPRGRPHRLIVALHPTPKTATTPTEKEK
jgi:DNA-binding transcriptional ArsR family regulator